MLLLSRIDNNVNVHQPIAYGQGVVFGSGFEAKIIGDEQKHEQYIQCEREETVIDQERAQ